MNVARDIAVQMCDVFDAKDYVGIVNVSYIAAVRIFALLCFALLCFALLCFALLCFAMLCYALLCFALLCFASFSLKHPTPWRLSKLGDMT